MMITRASIYYENVIGGLVIVLALAHYSYIAKAIALCGHGYVCVRKRLFHFCDYNYLVNNNALYITSTKYTITSKHKHISLSHKNASSKAHCPGLGPAR